jgi:hypothetical protein
MDGRTSGGEEGAAPPIVDAAYVYHAVEWTGNRRGKAERVPSDGAEAARR